MWYSFWRSVDRFSLQHFKCVINELRQIKVVHKHNRELVIDLLQSIAEIVTYGDKRDSLIFECFMELQVLELFARILKVSGNSRIEAPFLQYLSIMIQNMDSEHAIYYCLSNDHINNIISYSYKLDEGDLALYFVSFLRAVSSKLNSDTLCLLVKVHKDTVVSFPLYSEALKFAHSGDKMIQTAVRAITLNVYNVSDDMVNQFVTSHPVSKYFSELVINFREQCVHLDARVRSAKKSRTQRLRDEIYPEADNIVDDLCYFKDILSVGECCIDEVLTRNLLGLFVFPIVLPLLHLRSNGSSLSALTSLYTVSRLLQVVGGKNMINSIAVVLLHPNMISNMGDATCGQSADGTNYCYYTVNLLNDLGVTECIAREEAKKTNESTDFEHLNGSESYNSHFVKGSEKDNICEERSGILAYVFSDDSSIMMASLFLLLILEESKGPEFFPSGVTSDISAAVRTDESVLVRFIPQILTVVLKVLASQPPFPALIQWHIGWYLRKLLALQRSTLDSHDVHLLNTSYEQSSERLLEELDGAWFDHIVETTIKEWESCKIALEEHSHSKDPLFVFEVAACHQISAGDTTTFNAWEKMVDSVKVFVLHLHLLELDIKGDFLEKNLLGLIGNPRDDPGRTHASNLSCASFGSEVSLGSGVPCKIAYSNAGIRDIYLIPVARELSGKLILAEKHPFRTQRGVVFSIAPLAGSNPKIDVDHPKWLHLQLREFDPRLNTSKKEGHSKKMANPAADGRWTLCFHDAKACEDARLLILKKIHKQRSFIKSILAPLFQKRYLENF